ncbi:MAG: Hpt domain-containing protein [Pseudobacteriovorax sp.]|nr:Hpt domain-containing protein [Pseudobacteriovorax sp.]
MRVLKYLYVIVAMLCAYPLVSFGNGVALVSPDEPVKNLASYVHFFNEGGETFTATAAYQRFLSEDVDKNTKSFVNLGFSEHPFWLKYSLQNQTTSNLTKYLEVSYAALDEVDFFVFQNGELTSQSEQGDQRAFDNRPLNSRTFLHSVEIPANSQTVVLVRIKATTSLTAPSYLWSPKAYAKNENKISGWLLAFAGCALIMAAYNLFIYFVSGTKHYLIYSGFVLLSFLIQGGLHGYGQKYFWGDTFWINQYATSVLPTFNCWIAIVFCRGFLNTKKYFPKEDTFLFVFSIICLGITGISMVYNSEALSQIRLLVFLLVSSTVLSYGIRLAFKGNRGALIYSSAWVFYISGTIGYVSTRLGVSQNVVFEYGQVIGTALEILLLSLALANKLDELKKQLRRANEELKKHLENVEALVEEKTREIRSIMKHIQLGIMVVKGRNLEVTETYSHALTTLFHRTDIKSQQAVDFILDHAIVTQEVKDQVHTVLRNAIDDDELNFMCNAHLLPEELNFTFSDEQNIYQLDWSPVITDDDTVEKIIVSVRNVTSQKALEAKAKEREVEMSFIAEILGVKPKEFSEFLESSLKFMQDNLRLLKLNAKLGEDTLKLIFINLHTIKGAARALSLGNLTPKVHEVEQSISDMMNGRIPADRDKCIEENKMIEELLNYYEQLNSSKLGRNTAESISISHHFLANVHRQLLKMKPVAKTSERQELEAVCNKLEDYIYCDAESFFRQLLADAEMLARDLDKEYPSIEIQSNRVRFSESGQTVIRNAFVHIIRNSMDHGLETKEVRLSKGKSANGLLSVNLIPEGNYLKIVYGDDGAGLNLSVIKRIGLEKGLVRPDEQLEPIDIVNLIFSSGFSTAVSVSDISGRGVGMNSIKQYFESVGGSIEVEIKNDTANKEGHVNFVLNMNLPSEYYTVNPIDTTLKSA